MDNLELACVNHFTLGKHHLTPATRIDDLVRIAGDIGGLHATGVTTPYLSLRARTRTFARDDLDRELYEQRRLVKLRCVRNTIYVHPLDAVPFVFRATTARVTKSSARFLPARGISPEQFRALSDAITALLKGADTAHPAEMTAAAIKQALQARADTEHRQDLAAVLNLLCDLGVLVRARPKASWRDRRQNYALWSEYFPGVDLRAMDEREAIQRLIQHYLAAFGPATENDVVWWTGLGKRIVRAARADLADQITQATIAGLDGEFIVLGTDLERLQSATVRDPPVVNLLPWLDPYVMGYKDRARYLDPRDADRVFDRSGNSTSTILVSGWVTGVWDTGDDREPTIKLLLFRPLGQGIRAEIEAAAQEMGSLIYDRAVRVRWCTSMVPLTERTAGSMMSPLKGCPFVDQDPDQVSHSPGRQP